MAGYPPELLEAIKAAAAKYGVPADVLVATTLVESTGRLDAVGDNGRSHGPFQEYDLGRGAGLSIDERRDPQGSADRAAREFASFKARGCTGAELAYRAQRPADREGYIAKVNAALPTARQLLAGGGGGSGGGLPGAVADGVDAVGGALTGAGGAVADAVNPFPEIAGAFGDAIKGLISFTASFVPKVLVFVLLGVIAVWLVGQGASRAFGTPAPGAVINRAIPGG